MTTPSPFSGTPSAPSRFVARTPTDLVALVPLVLGFHPADSVVLLTFGPPGRSFHARVDLPVGLSDQRDVVAMLVGAVRANGVDRTAVLLYTEDVGAAEAIGTRLLDALLDADAEVIEVMRVEDGRWFVVPEDGTGGTPFDLDSHPFTAQGVFGGQVVHRDRAAVADSLVALDEEDAREVEQSVARARALVVGVAGGTGATGLVSQARWVQRVLRRHVGHAPLDAEDAGRLLVLASLVPTRDVAWAEISRESASAHVELWRDLVRRAPADLLPGAASLLAFAAWQHGDGALAWCALDRALEADPDYSMAHCIAELLTRAVPPSVWEGMGEEDLPVFWEEASGGLGFPHGQGRRPPGVHPG